MPTMKETDALAAMMGADSRRIDDLVGTVGQVKGDVSHMRGDVARVVKGVDELKEAMVGVARHTVLMESHNRDIESLRTEQRVIDTRVQAIERKVGGWDEARLWLIRAGLLVLGTVGMAIVGLVLKGANL